MSSRSVLVAIVAATIVIAGCAADDGPDPTDVSSPDEPAVTTPEPEEEDRAAPDDETPAPDEEPAAQEGSATDESERGEVTDEPHADDVVVQVQQFRFRPDEITVEAGETVAWPNLDQTTHTVTFDDGGPDSGDYGHEQTYRLTFEEPGTFTYICEIHPYMTGSVTVEN